MLWVAAMYNVLAVPSMTVFLRFSAIIAQESIQEGSVLSLWKQTTSICTQLCGKSHMLSCCQVCHYGFSL